jgi:hypothetical protein
MSLPAPGYAAEPEAMTHAYVKDIMTAEVVAVRADAPYRNMAAMFEGVVAVRDRFSYPTPARAH